MQLGIHFMNFTLPGEPATLASTLSATAIAAEEIGCTWFSMMDHWFQMENFGVSEDPMLEGYTSLGYVAALTKKMELGLLVTGVTYRHPGLLAKIVTTLDVLSEGRAMLGIGAAWYEREHNGLGVAFPPIRERFERLEETLQICLQMWSDNDGPYEGKYYQLAETICSPRPVSAPRPRIMVGGSGEKKTLRLVAQYADACNLFAPSADVVAHKIEVLNGHCADVGRDPSEIQKTIIGGGDPVGDPDAFLREMEGYAKLGVTHVQLAPRGNDPEGYVRALGERVIPGLANF
jgi:F420-dependent oxidoreductase-like protein